MHRTGSRHYNELQWNILTIQSIVLDCLQMAFHTSHLLITNDTNLRGVVLHENPYQSVYELFSPHPHQRFGFGDTFLSQP